MDDKQLAERAELLSHDLPDDYNEDVEETEEHTLSRHERRAAEAKKRLEAGRRAKIAAKTRKARKRRSRRKKARK